MNMTISSITTMGNVESQSTSERESIAGTTCKLLQHNRYLTIQIVRYFWNRESNQNAKILHKVDYPVELDVYDLCSEDLHKKLKAPRKGSSNVSGESSNATSKEGVVPNKEMHLTGIYDLVAMLTHKGRSADSGHYVAWVKQESGIWIQYVDRNPISQQEEDITKLSGEVSVVPRDDPKRCLDSSYTGSCLIHNLESRYSFDLLIIDDVFVVPLSKYGFVEIRVGNYLNLVS
ncbi:hypothetical protein RHGRI_035115 [Rhododendron griersonianum]|uniref:ubiquitinyl hydrolase 1 n=1 Tax=Rhododendron griersonianum TaxID=479676 RepID=A0AAV6I3Q3_9ERIC|nr:hypothetical protein RHGRI_035115 [Rhododendron griersonianum]